MRKEGGENYIRTSFTLKKALRWQFQANWMGRVRSTHYTDDKWYEQNTFDNTL